MSKLFKLRDWLTIEQACQHLTTVLGEPVERADLLRLALDGHLTLSVNFVNHAQVNNGGGTQAGTHAHVEKTEAEKNELLEHQHGNTLDTGTQGTSGCADRKLEAVGAVNRAAHA